MIYHIKSYYIFLVKKIDFIHYYIWTIQTKMNTTSVFNADFEGEPREQTYTHPFSSDALNSLYELYKEIIDTYGGGINIKCINDGEKYLFTMVYETTDKLILYSWEQFVIAYLHKNENSKTHIHGTIGDLLYYHMNDFSSENIVKCRDCEQKTGSSFHGANFVLCRDCLRNYLPTDVSVNNVINNDTKTSYFQHINNTINLYELTIDVNNNYKDTEIYQYKYLSVNDTSLTSKDQEMVLNIYWRALRKKILLIDNIKFICDVFNQEILCITKEVKLNFITSFGIY
jgi:hypothetical protein